MADYSMHQSCEDFPCRECQVEPFEDAPAALEEFKNLFFQSEDHLGPIGNHPGEPILNSYWVVHPERGLAWYMLGQYAYPQTNNSRRVSEIIVNKMYPWAEVKFFPMVFMPPHLKAQNDRLDRQLEAREEREREADTRERAEYEFRTGRKAHW